MALPRVSVSRRQGYVSACFSQRPLPLGKERNDRHSIFILARSSNFSVSSNVPGRDVDIGDTALGEEALAIRLAIKEREFSQSAAARSPAGACGLWQRHKRSAPRALRIYGVHPLCVTSA